MKKYVKKHVSLLMVAIMVLTAVSINDSVYAMEKSTGYDLGDIEGMASSYYNSADNIDWEYYLSNHYTTSPVIDLINIGMDNKTVAPGLVESMQNNAVFQTAYAEWELSTFVGNPGETVEKILNRELYYETVLFKLLNASVNSDNAIDWINQGAIKHLVTFTKYLSTASELDYRYNASFRFPISDLTSKEKEHLEALAGSYVSSQNYKIIGDDLSFISEALSISKSIEEYSERIATYLQLAHLSASTIEYLEILKTNSSDNLLTKALETVLAVSSDSFCDFMKVASSDGAVTLSKSAISSYIGSKWKNALVSKLTSGVLSTGYTILNGALLANSLGKTISNIWFSTSKKLDHYELTKALVAVEETIKSTANSILSNDFSGTLISKSIEMLYKMYDLDCDLCLDLVNIMDSDWIKLSTTEQRNKARADISEVKSFYNNQYNRICPKIGTCGNNLYWIFDQISGELLICGYGDMKDFSKESAPWYSYKDSIKSIHISSLCSQVGSYAFYNLSNIKAPIILTSYAKYDVKYGEGCFDSINSNIPIVFTENSKLEYFRNSSDNVYALKSISCDKYAMFRNLHVKDTLHVSDTLKLLEGGSLYAKTLSTYEACFILSQNTNFEIHGKADFVGPDHNPFTTPDTYYSALKLYEGAKINIYGNARFCSGIFDVYNGASINVTGDCNIEGGGICQGTYFNNYGDIVIENKLTVKGGYCRDSILRVYGTLTVGSYDYGGCTGGDPLVYMAIYGSVYITDETAHQDVVCIMLCNKSAYLSIHGSTYLSFYSSQKSVGTVELYNDAYFSKGENDLTLIFSGSVPQTVNGGLSAGTFIINNKQGVTFSSSVTSNVLFNHKQNPFTLNGKTNTFQDYDNDGLKDNVDTYPLDPLNGNNNTDFNVKMSNSNLTITGYNGADKNIVIPDHIDGYKVTAIDSIFDGCDFETVTIGANVTSISATAFNGVDTLKNIDVSTTNEKYSSDEGILYTKNKDKLIKYPSDKAGVSYEIRDTVTTINSKAFYNTKLKEVSIPESVTTIGANAFSNSQIEIIRIPRNVKSIGLNAFSNCKNLRTIYYDAVDCSISSILNICPFPSCVENFVVGENVESIPAFLLKGASVKEIIIPQNVISIDDNAFYNCDGLTIKAFVNSCAKEYAEKNGYDFVPITCGSCLCNEWEVEIDSTCTSVGKKSGICSVCGAPIIKEIPTKNHNYGDWEIIKEATCISEGLKTKTCADCEDVIAEIIAKTAHRYMATNIKPTCTEDGYTKYICSVCRDSYTDNVVTAAGHTDTDNNGICDACGEKLEHSQPSDPSKDCTCMCHKTGFMNFIYKIIRIFWKIFRINKTCSCGAVHY